MITYKNAFLPKLYLFSLKTRLDTKEAVFNDIELGDVDTVPTLKLTLCQKL